MSMPTAEQIEAELRRTDLTPSVRSFLKSLLFGMRYSVVGVRPLNGPKTDFDVYKADLAELERRVHEAMRVKRPKSEA